eukprot:375445-Rhodomonas_salina.1
MECVYSRPGGRADADLHLVCSRGCFRHAQQLELAAQVTLHIAIVHHNMPLARRVDVRERESIAMS